MGLPELSQCVVSAGESEKYLLSDDSDNEGDKKLDTVEESQEEPAPVEEPPMPDSNANAESAEKLNEGGGDSAPEEAGQTSADPEPPAPEEPDVPLPSEPELATEGSIDEPEASEPPPEVEASPVTEDVKEEQPAESTPVEEAKEEEPPAEPTSAEEAKEEEAVADAPDEKPSSEPPAPGKLCKNIARTFEN